MKKLLVLMLVLGMGTLASAGMMLTPDVDEIEAETLEIGVLATGGITGFEFMIEVVGGTIAGDPVYPEAWMFAPYTKGRGNGHIDVTGGDFFPKAGDITVLTGLTITRTADEAIVSLIATGDNNLASGVIGKGTIMDQVVLTPEPMSLALLGLGGLFLRRRK